MLEALEKSNRAMYQQAIAECEDALRIDPSSEWALWSLANAKAGAAFTGVADNPEQSFREAKALPPIA